MARPRLPKTARGRWLLLGGTVVIFVYGASGGCYAESLPRQLSAVEKEMLAQPPLPYRVAIVRANLPGRNGEAYAKGLLDALQPSGAFASVKLAENNSVSPDFVATSTGAYCNTAALPLLTIISLGIIPTTFTDVSCDEAVFRSARSKAPSDSLLMRIRIEHRVMMGWLALPAGALPGWTHGQMKHHSRYRQLVRVAILSRRQDLIRLLSR
jgi:hypothetical protein